MKGSLYLYSLILFLLFFLFPVHSAGNNIFKLEKTAVSNLPDGLVVADLKSLSIDSKGNVFVFAGKPNGRECFIIKFNRNLEYIKQFGRDGKGPGEFTTKNSSINKRISIDTNGDVYVADYNPRRFVIFDNKGNYKKDIPIARDYWKMMGSVYNLKVVGTGTFTSLQYREKLPTMGLIFILEPPEIKVKHSFDQKDIRFQYSSFQSAYYGDNCLIDTDSEHIVFGNSQSFTFHIYDRHGKLKLKKEDKKRLLKPFSQKEMEYIIKEYFRAKVDDSPFRKNYLAQLRADRSLYNKILGAIKSSKNVVTDIKISGEYIYVFLVGDDISVENHWPVEMYNMSGQIVKKGYVKEIPARIWKNYAFFYARDEESDDPLILKYKIPGQLP